MPDENAPRILLYDLETSPNIGYCWNKWRQDIIDFQQEWQILCVAWKWLGERKIDCLGIENDGFLKDDADYDVVYKIHELFDQADIIIAHNGDSFDRKKANARFLYHGMKPPSPYKTVDTLKHARKHFKFNSNKLTDLGKILGIGAKVPTGGFRLWLNCLQGCPRAWAKMERYAKQDVRLLEKVYKKMLPWIDNHPNIGLYSGRGGCPNCGKQNLQRRGYSRTKTQTYRQYWCKSCGKWSRARLSESTGKADVT